MQVSLVIEYYVLCGQFSLLISVMALIYDHISARKFTIITIFLVDFLSVSIKMPECYLKLLHDRFLPDYFPFIIH